MNGETIVALSTPPGESGVAVIRISGPDAASILDGMAGGLGEWESHKVRKITIVDVDGECLDEVLAVVMRGPASYTGEDIAEIFCHGSMQIVSEIIEDVVVRGGIPSGPGEFTRRAFINGRVDLAQAEAVADLINSETKLQRRVALEHLEGGLSEKVKEIEDTLLEKLSLVELSIDFSEDVIETYLPGQLKEKAEDLIQKIDNLLASEVAGRKLRRGVRATFIGPRNAGKSSLYNALIGEERAIVSSVPGTTRDLLREKIHVGGFTCHLEDTAGIAKTDCEIEEKGMTMGRRAVEKSDVALFVLDATKSMGEGIVESISEIGIEKVICVLNKMDLECVTDEGEVREKLGIERVVSTSAITGEGLEDLRDCIYGVVVGKKAGEVSRERIAVNSRQGAAFRQAREALVRLEKALSEGAPDEIISLELRTAADACGKISGRSVTEDILDTIFSRFCVGK
jgi:tRNA modification GTPase